MKICAYFVSATVISAFSPFSNEKNLSDGNNLKHAQTK